MMVHARGLRRRPVSASCLAPEQLHRAVRPGAGDRNQDEVLDTRSCRSGDQIGVSQPVDAVWRDGTRSRKSMDGGDNCRDAFHGRGQGPSIAHVAGDDIHTVTEPACPGRVPAEHANLCSARSQQTNDAASEVACSACDEDHRDTSSAIALRMAVWTSLPSRSTGSR